MDAEFIRDLFAEFGPVQVRRMFGGAGVYADATMFALVVRDILYLKTEPDQTARFAAEGCGPFEYTREGRKATLTSYWRVPDRLYDEPGELAEWARQGALRGSSKAAAQAGALMVLRLTQSCRTALPAIPVRSKERRA